MSREVKGITLIALVITIIVLLILAAVSIAMLTEENGILTQANDAKTSNEQGKEKEQIQLAWNAVKMEKLSNNRADVTVKANELETQLNKDGADIKNVTEDGTNIVVEFNSQNKYTISNDGSITLGGIIKDDNVLDSTDETVPYLPSDDCEVLVNNLDAGIVVKDSSGNEWVWIEVPKSVTSAANTDLEIKNSLIGYVGVYRETGFDDIYQEELGIDEQTYNENYSAMLQNIKANGGFWIGRYEMGLEGNTQRTEETKDSLTGPALTQQNKIPYNNISIAQSQQLAVQMNPDTNKNISSIMYGIQWDLVCKYIDEKSLLEGNDIKSNSGDWGNYYDVDFEMQRGQYSEDDGINYKPITEPKLKGEYAIILLTTGASDKNSILNIYDFAGNESEWTLEKSLNTYDKYVYRGGCYGNGSGDNPAANRSYDSYYYSNVIVTSRPTLFTKK